MSRIWALGYASKGGAEALATDGTRIRIKAKPVGNQHAPDPQSFVQDFLSQVGADDIIVSPAGPNYTYLAGAYGKAGKVFWIDPGTFAKALDELAEAANAAPTNGKRGRRKKQTPAQALLDLFAKRPELFYEYLPTDAKVAALRLATQNWLEAEREATAMGNAYSQLLRRERDFQVFADPDHDAWIERYVSTESRKLKAANRRVGVQLTKEQQALVTASLKTRAGELYDAYFSAEGKAAKDAQSKLIQDRLQWFGVDELVDECEARVRSLLAEMPENQLFDGLVSEGAIKARAEVLAFMRNPLFYPCFAALQSYAGVGSFQDGQAMRRRRGERDRGNPEFRRALCFDFGEKYFQNDTVGFFAKLYYVYKEHQLRVYWPLVALTQDLWKALGRKAADEDEREVNELSDEEASGLGDDVVRSLVDRLAGLTHLPMIASSEHAQREIEALQEKPDAKRLWILFSKGNAVVDGKHVAGGNLQMPKKRIERQTKRFLGTVLLQAAYYRWLAQIGRPQPLEKDGRYVHMWRKVGGEGERPDAYDHEVVAMHYELVVDGLRKTHPLPPESEVVCRPPSARLAYLKSLNPADREAALEALTDKEATKLRAALTGNEPEAPAAVAV